MMHKMNYKYMVASLITLAFCLSLININLWKTLKAAKSYELTSKEYRLLSIDVFNTHDRPLITAVAAGAKKNKVKECRVDGEPQKSIFYVKVHKTGSTTLRSILLVYGHQYNLTICMDATDLWGMNWPYKVDNTKLTKLREEKCQIVAEELVYSPQVVSEIMADDVFVLSSVRHPVQHFMSLFKWSNIQKAVGKMVNNNSLDKWSSVRLFIQHYDIVQNMYATFAEEEVKDRLQINLVRPNLQLFDHGLKGDATFNEIERRINDIDFVVVAEKFDESMVVLRDKLCCSFEDVVYQKSNVKRHDHEKENEKIPPDIVDSIIHFNLKDMHLYKLAMKRLYVEMLKHENFEQMLGIYKYELKKHNEKCKEDSTLPDEIRKYICPPVHGGVGMFLRRIRDKQSQKLLQKLRKKYQQSL